MSKLSAARANLSWLAIGSRRSRFSLTGFLIRLLLKRQTSSFPFAPKGSGGRIPPVKNNRRALTLDSEKSVHRLFTERSPNRIFDPHLNF